MKKAIVLGALGFIGFALCECLLEEEYEVIGIDYIEGRNAKVQEQKLAQIARNSHFVYRNEQVEEVVFKDVAEKCDCLYFCLDDQEVNEDNINDKMLTRKIILLQVMDYCKEGNCQFIYLSSYEVFKKNPRNLTGMLKAAEEIEIEKYSQENPIFTFVILQLPTIYGPWQPTSMTFQQLIQGVTLPSLDPIQEDAIFINDLAEILVYIPHSQLKNKTIIISSNKKNQWHEGFNFLQKHPKNPPKENETKIEIPNHPHIFSKFIKTPIADGIKAQEEHYKYIERLRDFGLI
ncbi:MAG TPA: NAD(P)-dependent oxidoreductase [Bacillus bacterium]|nr:NAD(P)-dependent oxidoreductase [Bacillus sp. (in: firmicutes)]